MVFYITMVTFQMTLLMHKFTSRHSNLLLVHSLPKTLHVLRAIDDMLLRIYSWLPTLLWDDG